MILVFSARTRKTGAQVVSKAELPRLGESLPEPRLARQALSDHRPNERMTNLQQQERSGLLGERFGPGKSSIEIVSSTASRSKLATGFAARAMPGLATGARR